MSARDQNHHRNAPATVAIVGGGAAGLMAAYFASIQSPQQKVVLLEKTAGWAQK